MGHADQNGERIALGHCVDMGLRPLVDCVLGIGVLPFVGAREISAVFRTVAERKPAGVGLDPNGLFRKGVVLRAEGGLEHQCVGFIVE